MKKSYYLAAVVLGILLTTAAVSLTTQAVTTATTTQSNSNSNNTPQTPQLNNVPKAEIQAINQAIKNNDYTAWQKAMSDKVTAIRQQADKLESTINQDTFNKIVKAYQLIKEGKTAEAKAIFQQLGMTGAGHEGLGMMRGLHMSQRFGKNAN